MDFSFSKQEEEKVVEWNGNAFRKMKNLKTLIIKNARFSARPKHLPSSLRVLEWWRCPSQYLPSNFDPKKLSICMLPENCLLSCDLAVILKKFVNLTILNFDSNKCLTEIPDVSSVPNLEKLSFDSCDNLVTIHNSVGFLSKLKWLSVQHCIILRNFPPIKLPSLEFLFLSGCVRLEKFPEILGNMEKIQYLPLESCGIKEFPVSFQNLTQLYIIRMSDCRCFGKQRSIAMMLPCVEFLELYDCSVSDDFLQIGLAWFPNVKILHLEKNNFTVLPACIKECRFLRGLYVNECTHLREIRGIPPKLNLFSAIDCVSLTSSCPSMLLKQELHKARNPTFFLPGVRIPECFEHRRRGPSISFWFRNKFPSIALCLTVGWMQFLDSFSVIINGNKPINWCYGKNYISTRYWRLDHIVLLHLQYTRYFVEPILENEWNHAEVLCTTYNISNVTEIGIHVFEQENMEDIRFTDPCKRRGLDDVVTSPES